MAILQVEFYPELNIKEIEDADTEMKQNAKKLPEPFFFKPREHFDLNTIKAACDPILKKGIEHVIVLGTGGSIQTLLALKQYANKQVHPITSSRPTELKRLFKIPGLKDNSIVVPVSRGGKTLDVNANLYLFPRYDMLGLSSRGPMNNILKTMDVKLLEVPDLSGRFAASCTNVALLPAYLAGIDVNTFVDGLEAGYKIFDDSVPIQTNPAKKFALYLYKLFKNGYRNVFSMPYFSWLKGAVGLWVQELSESTGKEGLGLLGTYQEAPLCQHSVLELLLGGSKYHTVPLLWILEKDPHDIPLNNTIKHIQDKSAADTVLYQANATFEALLTQECPAAMITLEIPTLRNMGLLISFIQSTIYHLCLLFNVNWANNPNVLLGKEICNYAMEQDKSMMQMKETRKKVASEQFKDFWLLE
ncbi:hypothetical protein GF325_17400 [Candidatus Bathyarchaeota archaeon]|nr:hypothetical protein [Candidatus Bathyarchaeota archaeon]